MNRPYGRERSNSCCFVKTSNANMRLSTDVIVGYPGETEKEFNETISAFKQASFEMAFIFKYSERSGTPATQMRDKILKNKEERNQILVKILDQQSEISNNKLINKTMDILVESKARKGGDLMDARGVTEKSSSQPVET